MINILAIKATGSIAAVLALSACGGGGGGPLTEAEIISLGNSLISTYEPLVATSAGNLPLSGVATYSGAGASSPFASTPAGILASATSIFEVDVQINFSNNTIAGTASNFYCLQAGCNITGSVNATGTISGSTFVIGNYSGNLQTNGIPSTVTGSISGTFKGPTGEGLIGSGVGTETVSGSAPVTVWTYWGAERQ